MPEATTHEKSVAEREPEINLKFFYAPHGEDKPDDWKKLEDLLPWADVYAIEALGWGEEDRKLYESVSKGAMDLNRAQLMSDPLRAREFELLYNSHKPIVFADVPQGHAILAKERLLEWSYRKSLSNFRSGRFEDAMAQKTNAMRLLAEEVKQREKYIRAKIKTLIRKLKEDTEKREVNVLVRIGGGHSLMSRDMEREGVKSNRVFSHSLTLLSFDEEGVKRLVEDKEISSELVAASLVEDELTKRLWNLVSASEPAIYLLRQIISKLTFDDIQQISLALQQGKSLVSEIEVRGIKVPKTKEEAAQMIKEITKKWGPGRAKNQDLPDLELSV